MYCFEHLEIKKINNYAVIYLKRKPVNALTIQMSLDIENAVAKLAKDDDVKVIIITGGIKYSFSAGSDLEEILSIMKSPGVVSENMVEASLPVQKAFTNIAACPKVTIAVINGVTIGLGVELALACDIRIASDLSWFKMAQTNIGIIPGAGGTQRLPRLIGEAKAKELIFTGRKVKSQEARELGLVNKIVSHGKELERAVKIACEIIENSALNAVSLAKKAIQFGLYIGDIEEGLENEMKFFSETYHWEDSFEGIIATMEKRKPNFNHKNKLENKREGDKEL